MSNLNRPYEISVWDDILEGEKFVEKRLGVIGSDKMLSQNRALNPQLSRKVNGTKTFQFEMYRYYIDNITGKRIENPFTGWLISERKVKLKYAGKWYDFIIKDISENSSTYLYTYKLEDAAVIELSKNGFGVILDEQRNNNLGNPKTLAERVLEDTDWKVKSEVVVQKVEDALVRITIPVETKVIHLLDQTNLSEGVQETTTTITKDGADRVEVLAFYSSCANKPHRFQFIYLDNLADITTDKEGKINNINCQYYIDFESPEDDYYKVENTPFFLPKDFSLYYKNRGYLYTDARAERYSFAHQTDYIPKLDRYVYKYHKHIGDNEDLLEENESIDQDGFVEYTKEDGTKERKVYYGYYDSKYYSPTLIQNIVTNSRFDSTSGWIGTRLAKNGDKAQIRNVYGYFNGMGVFVNSADEMLKGRPFNPNNPDLAAYLEITLWEDSLVLNSGPYDNRIAIGNMEQGSEWQLNHNITFGGNGAGNFTVNIGEYIYDSTMDGYKPITKDDNTPDENNTNIWFENSGDIYTVAKSQYQEKTFKEDSKVYIAITGEGILYIKQFDLFRRVLDDNNQVIYPDNIAQQTDLITQNVVKNTYRYFTKDALDSATDATDLVPECTTKTLSYSTYVPIYNIGAEKVRTVSVKESNYFNILQSIAETFGAWLEIEVGHNEDGSIDKENKWVRFKNYIGKTNYANFRYGVNLKDIQRTYASKEIVTKLMVKPNTNQHANNGFCAIGRANSNPSGEDYIYDFRYFHEKGLMNPYEYLNDVYVLPESEVSPDKYNYEKASGYYSKIKYLNSQINDLNNNKIIPAQTDLTSLESKYAVAKAGYEAALDGIRKTKESFTKLFNISIDNISSSSITGIDIDAQNSYEEGWYNEDRYGHIHYMKTKGFEIKSVTPQKKNTIEWTIRITYEAAEDFGESVGVTLYPKLILKNNNETICKTLKTTIRPTETESPVEIEVGAVIDENNTAAQNKITEYITLRSSENLYQKQKNDWSIAITEKKVELAENEQLLDDYKKYKNTLNLAFFKKYSRFIQEGTWIDEKYSDDELYYADAKSVMYNSCYPKVAYTINVLALNMLPGYEGFSFELGDSTYVEDYEFFENKKEEVIITEFIEFLDQPDKDFIKVQNFKNQFKDLFQKITATVQQAQYSSGSYEKAVALAEANQARKQQFLTDALNGASARLQAAGQQSVVWDNTGLTITDVDAPSNQIRMIGGAILLKKQDENGQDRWTTGITSDGISASLITAGTINAGEIAIMNADEPVFRWDAFGITAFAVATVEEDFDTIFGPANPNKFVRFDKYGIYGINGAANGMEWHATSAQEIQELATFALTWEGLKIVGQDGGRLMIGKGVATMPTEEGEAASLIMGVTNNNNEFTFGLTENGDVHLKGEIEATKGFIGGWEISQNWLTSGEAGGVQLIAKPSPSNGNAAIIAGQKGQSLRMVQDIFKTTTNNPGAVSDTDYKKISISTYKNEKPTLSSMLLRNYKQRESFLFQKNFDANYDIRRCDLSYDSMKNLAPNVSTPKITIENRYQADIDESALGNKSLMDWFWENRDHYFLVGRSLNSGNYGRVNVFYIAQIECSFNESGYELIEVYRINDNGSKNPIFYIGWKQPRYQVIYYNSSSDLLNGYTGDLDLYDLGVSDPTFDITINTTLSITETFNEIQPIPNFIPLTLVDGFKNNEKVYNGPKFLDGIQSSSTYVKTVAFAKSSNRKIIHNKTSISSNQFQAEFTSQIEASVKINCQITNKGIEELCFQKRNEAILKNKGYSLGFSNVPYGLQVKRDTTLLNQKYQIEFKQLDTSVKLDITNNPIFTFTILKTAEDKCELQILEKKEKFLNTEEISYELVYSIELILEDQPPFVVYKDGSFFANNASISGEITATTFRSALDKNLKKKDGNYLLPILTLQLNGKDYMLYTTFTGNGGEITEENIFLNGFGDLGHLQIMSLKDWEGLVKVDET